MIENKLVKKIVRIQIISMLLLGLIIGKLSYSQIILHEEIEELAEKNYGTIVVCQSQKHLDKLMANNTIAGNFVVSSIVPSNKQNCILVRSSGLQEPISGYQNYVFMSSFLKNEHYLFDKSHFVFDLSVFSTQKIVETDRKIMGVCYNLIKKNCDNIFANDIFEWADKISFYDKRISQAQVLFALFVFVELGLFELSGICEPVVTCKSDTKVELTKSKFYMEF